MRLYELLGLFVAGTPDFMMLVSLDGTILYINRVRPGVSCRTSSAGTSSTTSSPVFGQKTRSSLLRVAATGQGRGG